MTDLVEFDSGELVLASEDERIVEGRLLPFGVEGHTNIGAFTVEAGAIALPADPDVIGLNLDHDREQPVGRAVAVEERSDGVYARYRIARTPEGDEVLEGIKSGKGARRSLSMEAKGVVVKAGKAIAGRIFGAALVTRPAFEGATVLAEYDPEHGVYAAEVSKSTYDDESESVRSEVIGGTTYTTTTNTKTSTTTVVETETPETPAESEETVPEATVPETVAAAKAPAEDKTEQPLGYREAFRVMAAYVNGTAGRGEIEKVLEPESTVFAAQSNVAFPVGTANPAPQWAGQFWGDIAPKPLVSDLLQQEVLTSRQVQGFSITTKPTGGDWAGNGAEITSTAVAFTPNTITASLFAGGNTVSRENLDFGIAEEFLNWYFTVQAQNFTSWLDGKALTAILGGLTAAAKDTVPTSPAIDEGTSVLVDAVVAYVSARNELPTFALVAASEYKKMLKVPATTILGYLNAALGLDEGALAGFTVRPVPDAKIDTSAGTGHAFKAIAGNRQGAKVYTLPGSPIRAESIDVAHGLVNLGVYGYGAVVPNALSAFYGVY